MNPDVIDLPETCIVTDEEPMTTLTPQTAGDRDGRPACRMTPAELAREICRAFDDLYSSDRDEAGAVARCYERSLTLAQLCEGGYATPTRQSQERLADLLTVIRRELGE